MTSSPARKQLCTERDDGTEVWKKEAQIGGEASGQAPAIADTAAEFQDIYLRHTLHISQSPKAKDDERESQLPH
jgi:capsule polysaccharide export protein KpsE/RkpR